MACEEARQMLDALMGGDRNGKTFFVAAAAAAATTTVLVSFCCYCTAFLSSSSSAVLQLISHHLKNCSYSTRTRWGLVFDANTNTTAPLPRGAAVPSKKRKHQDGGSSNGHGGDGPGMLLLPGKRSKSCFDTDICPLYTAWGVDVYELFVNTKSDLGPNPYVADDGARQEYLKLGKSERDRLGFDYFLFEKLNQLVRSCDRIVHRNKEKLQQELNRKLSQRGGQDFVEDVDENQATGLATNMVQLEMLEEDLETKLGELSKMVEREEGKKRELEPLLDAQRKIQQQKQQAETGKMEEEQEGNGDGKVKEEDGDDVKVRKEEGGDEKVRKEDGDDGKVKKEDDGKVKKEEDGDDEQKRPENDASKVPELTEEEKEKLQSLQLDLGRLTLDRQRAIFQVGRIMTRLAPLYEAVETQRRNLNYVKSDISTDKTVCEVSGNFMSARDADERIAAHYAGKQYVGCVPSKGNRTKSEAHC